MQNRDLALGAADGIVNEVELALQLLALLDLGAIGLQRRARLCDFLRHDGFGRGQCGMRRVAVSRHLRADRAQLGHDLAMQRIGLLDHFGNGQVADDCSLGAKTFAVNSHLDTPPTSLTRLFYTNAI